MTKDHPIVPSRKLQALQAQQHLSTKVVTKPNQVAIPLSSTTLDKLSQAMPAMRELARFAGGPRYEAYFTGGKAAQVTKAGHLSIVQHDGKKITETAKIRSLRPGQLANLGFSFVTAVVGMEHMARINRQLGQLNEKMDEIAAMLADELAAPVKDIAGSIHRFTPAGVDGVPREMAEGWVRDLRRVRQLLIAKVQRIPGGIQPSTSFWWGSQMKDLKVGAAQMVEASQFIELLAASDAMLHRMAASLDAPWALDGVDGAVAVQLAQAVRTAATALMASTDKDCSYDKTGKLQLERDQALGTTQRAFTNLVEQLAEAEAFRDVAVRLMDEKREFCLTIENDKVLGLSEVSRTASA